MIFSRRDQRDGQPVVRPPSQIFQAVKRRPLSGHDHAAEKLRQREGDGAGRPASAAEAGQVRLVGIDVTAAAHVIQGVQEDADPLTGSDVVADAVGAQKIAPWSSQVFFQEDQPSGSSPGDAHRTSGQAFEAS